MCTHSVFVLSFWVSAAATHCLSNLAMMTASLTTGTMDPLESFYWIYSHESDWEQQSTVELVYHVYLFSLRRPPRKGSLSMPVASQNNTFLWACTFVQQPGSIWRTTGFMVFLCNYTVFPLIVGPVCMILTELAQRARTYTVAYLWYIHSVVVCVQEWISFYVCASAILPQSMQPR